MGCIMNGYNGVQPSVDAVRWMDFGKDELTSITYFPLCELSYLLEDLSVLEDVPPATREMATAADALPVESNGLKVEGSVTVDNGDKGLLPEGDALASARTDTGGKVDESSAIADEDIEETLVCDPLDQTVRQRYISLSA